MEGTRQCFVQVAEAFGCGMAIVQFIRETQLLPDAQDFLWLKRMQKKQKQMDKCQDCIINHIICSFFLSSKKLEI